MTLTSCVSKSHPGRSLHQFLNFYHWIISRYVDIPNYNYPFFSWWTFGLFSLWAIINNAAVNIWFCMDINFYFSWVYAPEKNCWVTWSPYLSLTFWETAKLCSKLAAPFHRATTSPPPPLHSNLSFPIASGEGCDGWKKNQKSVPDFRFQKHTPLGDQSRLAGPTKEKRKRTLASLNSTPSSTQKEVSSGVGEKARDRREELRRRLLGVTGSYNPRGLLDKQHVFLSKKMPKASGEKKLLRGESRALDFLTQYFSSPSTARRAHSSAALKADAEGPGCRNEEPLSVNTEIGTGVHPQPPGTTSTSWNLDLNSGGRSDERAPNWSRFMFDQSCKIQVQN